MNGLLALSAALLVSPLLLAQTAPKPPKVDDPALRIQLIAAAPEVEACTTVCGDPGGAIYVGNDLRHARLNTKEAVCTIVRYSSVGPEKKRTVFADNLYSPAGSAWHDGWLYVIHDPLLSRFKDTDGDGVADVREDLITNLGVASNDGLDDHVVSGFTLGMDGCFYISVGDRGIYQAQSVREAKAAAASGERAPTLTMRSGGIIRCRADGTELEIFSTGTRNHLSVNLDAEDHAFTRDTADDGHGWGTRLTHHVEGGYYGYPYDYQKAPNYGVTQPSAETLEAMKRNGAAGKVSSSQSSVVSGTAAPASLTSAHSPLTASAPFLPAMADFGGGSPTGGLCYLSDGLPEKYRGKHFFSESGKAGLFVTEVAPDGATFKLVSDTKLVESDKGGEFRPTQIAVAADGSLLIADWGCDAWNHPKVAGAVWRLSWPEAKPAPRLKQKASIDEMVAALGHPDRDQRLRAQWALVRRAADEELAAPQPRPLKHAPPGVPNTNQTSRPFAEQEQSLISRLTKLVADASASEVQRCHALWAIREWAYDDRVLALPQFQDGSRAKLNRVPQRVAKAIASSPSAALRAQVARLVGEEDRETFMLAFSALKIVQGDPDPAVRLQAAIARGRVGLPGSEDLQLALALVRDPDPWVRNAGRVSLRRLMWWPVAFSGITSMLSGPDEQSRDASFCVLETGVTDEALRIVGPYAAMRLQEGHGNDVIEMLERSAESSDAALRVRALSALGNVAYRAKQWDGHWWGIEPVKTPPPPHSVPWPGTRQALASLTAALSDPDSAARLAAARAFTIFTLDAANKEAAAALRARLTTEKEPAIREQLIEALRLQKDPAAAEPPEKVSANDRRSARVQ